MKPNKKCEMCNSPKFKIMPIDVVYYDEANGGSPAVYGKSYPLKEAIRMSGEIMKGCHDCSYATRISVEDALTLIEE